MDLGWRDNFFGIVIPAWQAFLTAENDLVAAGSGGDEDQCKTARLRALREGASAAWHLHHFIEIVWAEKPDWLPEGRTLRQTQDWLSSFCTWLRTDNTAEDVQLLGDVADALKHAHLRNQNRKVASRDAVLVIDTGFSELPFGEGRFGGVEQVIVLTKDGKRALSAVLQNVVDAWRRAMGVALPELNHP